MKTLRISSLWARVEMHSTGQPPNCRPLLKVFDCRKAGQPLIAELELSDFMSSAQWLYEGELTHNYNVERNSAEFCRGVKRVRKALGFSYP